MIPFGLMMLLPLWGVLVLSLSLGIVIGSLLRRDRTSYIMASIIACSGVALLVPLWM
jgi:hypothetical protein